MLACFQEVVRLLIGAKANVEASRKGGFSPLYIACQCGSEAVVDLLLESGADANHANEAGLSPFTAACHGARISPADAITNPKDLERAWVLCAAAKDPIKELGCFAGGVLPVAKLLSAGGAAAEHPTRLGRTAVWIASYSGRLSVV